MITVIITHGKVTILNGGSSREFNFDSPTRTQHFIDGLTALLPFVDVDYRIVDERR